MCQNDHFEFIFDRIITPGNVNIMSFNIIGKDILSLGVSEMDRSEIRNSILQSLKPVHNDDRFRRENCANETEFVLNNYFVRIPLKHDAIPYAPVEEFRTKKHVILINDDGIYFG
ncbi:hypothetical protein KR215_009696 [Drosophila sulfurigaster]|nr:hypothetical protein KR215_009696 [Drosophila sulfurigaster]